MRMYPYLINLNANEEKEFRIKVSENERILFVSPPEGIDVKIQVSPGRFSEIKHPFWLIMGNRWMPCFAKDKKGVLFKVKALEDVSGYMHIFLAQESEKVGLYGDKEIRLWVEPIKEFGKKLIAGESFEIYRHNEESDVFLASLVFSYTGSYGIVFKVRKNEEEMVEEWMLSGGESGWRTHKRIETFLKKDDVLSFETIEAPDDAYAYIHLIFSNKEFSIINDPFLCYTVSPKQELCKLWPEVLQQVEEIPETPEPEEPDGGNPYPTPPDEQRDIVNIPEILIPFDYTKIQKDPFRPGSVKLARSDEQKVVQVMMSPLDPVRPTADVRARQRVTDADLTYTSGMLSVTNTEEKTIISDVVIRTIRIYARKGGWGIKVLPLYDSLAGKSIDDMPFIYVDEKQNIELKIEAIEVKVKCFTASDTSPGEILYYLGV